MFLLDFRALFYDVEKNKKTWKFQFTSHTQNNHLVS